MTDDTSYDMIVVGSGNGACGFLSYYLQASADERILIIEEGEPFFQTSDITHQSNWTRSYLEGRVLKVHRAFTPGGIPIISGRACTMGGGGSINYTMVHESSAWLTNQMGRTIDYWDNLKAELNAKFARPDPTQDISPVTEHIVKQAKQAGFQPSQEMSHHIPNHPEGNVDRLYLFPTQFNRFGQRTNSGVSIVDWSDPRVELKTRHRVKKLKFTHNSEGKARCVGVQVQDIDQRETQDFPLKADGKLILGAGAATPQLLFPHQETLQNPEIGQHVSDHIAIPLGLYILDPAIEVTPRDNYVPVFATTVWEPETQGRETICSFDFFSGNVERLLFFLVQLFFPFLLPNGFKKILIQAPNLFYIVKNIVRVLIQILNQIINVWWSISDLLKGKSWKHQELALVTAIIKYNPGIEGHYSQDGSRITLDFFGEAQQTHFNQDQEVAKSEIKQHLNLMNSLGQQPPRLFKCFLRLLTQSPYQEDHVDRYVAEYSKRHLLSEQHVSGGCLFGKAIDQGLDDAKDTGLVHGAFNVYVADLSSVSLPRISPQMTAYLIGFHVAKNIS